VAQKDQSLMTVVKMPAAFALHAAIAQATFFHFLILLGFARVVLMKRNPKSNS